MNILIITQIFPQPDDVGDDLPTSTVLYFAKEWVKKGNRVIVIHCPSKFPILFYLAPKRLKDAVSNRSNTTAPVLSSRKFLKRVESGVEVYRLPMMKMYPGKGFSKRAMKKHTKQICSLLDQLGVIPDIVMGHFANPSLELVVRIAAKYDAKSSIVFHHDCNDTNIEKYRIRELISKIGAIGARSVIEANDIQKKLDLRQKPFICYSGVPNKEVESCDTVCTKHNDYDGLKFLYVGSMLTRKHVDTVIKAFSDHVRLHPSCHSTLKIIGGGQEESYLKKMAYDFQLSDRINFMGKLSRSEVMYEMKKADVFAMVSSGETFGMVYIEAMLQGCITIASFGEGFDGIIHNSRNGFLCKAADSEMLERIFEKIYAMTGTEKNAIGQSAIDTALRYSESAVAIRYLSDAMKQENRGGF